MPNHASINLIGHVGADPIKSNRADVAQFDLAVSTGYGDNKTTTWYRINVWGKSSEYVMNYLRKGHAVHVHGEPYVREWVDKDGNKRQSLEVRALSVQGLTREDAPQAAPEPRSAPQAQRPAQRPAATATFDDSLPF